MATARTEAEWRTFLVRRYGRRNGVITGNFDAISRARGKIREKFIAWLCEKSDGVKNEYETENFHDFANKNIFALLIVITQGFDGRIYPPSAQAPPYP